MALTDPISNFLTCIRNAMRVSYETVDVPASKMTEKILGIIKIDGYIEDYRLMKTNAQGSFKVYLKYNNKKPAITGFKRISKPGLRVYSTRTDIPRVLNGLGTAIVSTSRGVMTDREARKLKVGGEVICYIW
jgi:small subunit ribosomal protein S8